uniref:Uncharacterized protein n=1 Tax=Nelumbo nucifera TaxID=4432 RepID=A0A822YJQ0_NELNU|nr:TPA_asm: hypothetical protein HUJ06_011588 [Nelumbo nucifera]
MLPVGSMAMAWEQDAIPNVVKEVQVGDKVAMAPIGSVTVGVQSVVDLFVSLEFVENVNNIGEVGVVDGSLINNALVVFHLVAIIVMGGERASVEALSNE